VVNFALIGVGGFVAPRHLKAIHDTGHKLVAAVDKNDSVGVLDRYFPDAEFFVEIERFDRFLDKRRRGPEADRIQYVSVCSPNYLHDAHMRMALRAGADVLCEKPLVINPWNLDALEQIEQETGQRVYTVLQLRLHPTLIALKQRLDAQPAGTKADVSLTYVTHRGPWYDISWKGAQEKSGGVAMNIGIHFFDLIGWLFGRVESTVTHLSNSRQMSGVLELERARVSWYLSVERDDLPAGYLEAGRPAFRSLTLNGEEVEFSEGFTDLHTRVYEEMLAGRGYGIADARPSIELVHQIRHAEITPAADHSALVHPYLLRK
jgi:UDP-N-acetyl-2-amino-2-deoxyglucuronate dehydrogenase